MREYIEFMNHKSFQITEWCHRFIRDQVQPGDICIDATAGNGYDTLLLHQLVGEDGYVFAFDIQEEAIIRTAQLVDDADAPGEAEYFVCGHEQMKLQIPQEAQGQINCIMFNFGYLPGGSHEVSTTLDTSVEGIQQGLELLQVGGLMSLLIYSGGDTGFDEKTGILQYVKTLDTKQYVVISNEYCNRPNHPPMLVLIYKLR